MLTFNKVFLLLLVVCIGCGDPPVPKPTGYFRIDLPEQSFISTPTPCGIRFETPDYSRIAFKGESDSSCFVNVHYVPMRAKLHLTYRHIEGNLRALINDAQGFKNAHQAKANKIESFRVLRDSARVFGSMYAVDGDVASPMVFYLTDSTTNFLYGSLYFSVAPNGDSLAPVSARLREDIRHLGATLQWPE